MTTISYIAYHSKFLDFVQNREMAEVCQIRFPDDFYLSEIPCSVCFLLSYQIDFPTAIEIHYTERSNGNKAFCMECKPTTILSQNNQFEDFELCR